METRTFNTSGRAAEHSSPSYRLRLRKIMPSDDYVDLLHERAQPSKQPPIRWGLGSLLLGGLVAAFIASGPLLRLADDTAATVDTGALSLLLLAVIGALTFHLLAKCLARRLHSWAYRLSGSASNEPVNEITPWQHAYIFLGCYASLFWGAVAVLLAIL